MKKTVAFLLIVFSVGAVVFGAYLPFMKARLFIAAIQTPIAGLERFRAVYDRVFTFPSFIGGEETVKFLASTIDGWVANEKDPTKESAVRDLVAYIEPRIFSDNPRHLILMANIYNNLLIKYGRQEDLDKIVDYHRRVLAIGPNLPHGLYGLFTVYYQAGMKAEAKDIGERILTLWPQDQQIREIISSL